MKNCPFCKAQIEDNARFCLYCMSPLTEKKAAKKIKPSKKGWQIISAVLLVFTTAIVLLLSAGEGKSEPTLSFSQIQTETDISDIFENSPLPSESGGYERPSESTNKGADTSTNSRVPIVRPHYSGSNSSDGYSYPEYEVPSWYEDLFGTSSNSGSTSSASTSASSKVNSTTASTSSRTSPASNSPSSKVSSTSAATSSKAASTSNTTITNLTDGYYTYSVLNSKATITEVRANKISGAVTIPSKLGGYDVVSLGEECFRGCNKITSLVIPEGVTHIGMYAFSGCTAITRVTIPESIYRIDMQAFSGCHALIDINLPDKIISIGDSAFSGTAYYQNYEAWEANDTLYLNDYLIATYMTATTRCEPKEGTKALIDQVYYGCDLKSFKLPKSLIYIGEGAFSSCSGLTSITIPGHIKYIGPNAFCFFDSLENVTIESGITTISAGMFYECKNLETIKIPKSVTSIEMCAFTGCKYLTDIYYEGSKADRDKMLIDSKENSYLLNATWHYNS